MTTQILVPSIISSFIEVVITQPIDVVKTLKQTNQKFSYNFKTLYSGFIPRASGNIPSRTVFLFSQDYLRSELDPKKFQNKILIPSIAGFTQTLIDTPVENLKMKQIFKLHKVNYYKGFLPHVTRNIIFLVPVFNFKEYGKQHHDNALHQAFYGAIGGIIGSYLSHPFDTIKTLVQTNKEFHNGYFRGSHLRASMAFINMAISLTVFEYLKETLFF
jgi:H+/Cl- antiporter ClcA